jgi:ubiquinone/menaquinone biosynthesis C-methylase UbiE
MKHYEETFSTWNKIASLYQEKFMDLDLYNQTYDTFCQLIKPRYAELLEIGCGPGNITKHLLKQRTDFNIYGIDIAPNMIELARLNNSKAQFEVMDAREISTLKRSFDGLVCGFCLPYLSHDDGEKLIQDSSNLLNENGILYISFVEGDPELSNFQVGSSGDRTYFYFYRLKTLKAVLAKYKLRELETIHVNYPKTNGEIDIHTIVIAQKNDSNFR